MRHLVTSLALGLLAASTALAEAPPDGFYAGVSVGNSLLTIENSESTLDFEGDGVGYELMGGYQFVPHFAVEVSFIDYGTTKDTVAGQRIEGHFLALSGNAVGMVSPGPFDLFLKGGIGAWQGKLRNVDFGGSERESRLDPTIGLGVQWRFSQTLAVRAQAQSLLIGLDDDGDGESDDDDSVDLYSLGFLWRFR